MASWRQWLVAGGLLLAFSCARAAVHMQADTVELPGVRLGEVRLVASLAEDGRPRLQFDAAKVTVPSLGWNGVAVQLTGEPQRAGGRAWKFVGHVATRHAPGDALSDADLTVLYDPDAGTLEVDVVQGDAHVTARMPLDQTSHVQMKLAALPLGWLRGVLASAWPDGRLAGGKVAGRVALDIADDGSRVSGRVEVAGAQLDTRSGGIAASKLGASGTFLIDNGPPSARLMFDGVLNGGELLFGPVYAQLPAQPANLHVSATLGPQGVTIGSLDFDDNQALRVTGSLGFDRKGNLDKLDLSRLSARFPLAYTRYGTTFVQSLTGWSGLQTSGDISGSLAIDGGRFQAFDLTANNVDLAVGDGSLSVSGLDGALDWRAGKSRPATTLKWNALTLYKLAFGPAALGLEDKAGELTLRSPVTMTLFGGGFTLGRFGWRPDAGKEQRLSAALTVTDVDLRAMCKAFGWPAFGGKLGGAVPDISYRGDDLVFGGGLSLDVFDGSVSVTNLSMRHPFGDAPALAADIQMRQLDLAQLTGVFDFGQITGKLDGDIDNLRMVDWRPVAFTASLAANGGGKISQHAIKSLTEVGGGGIAGGIQGMALRLFKTFGYARIGLTCALANGVCTMGGITPDPDPSDEGFTIVEGSGLPHITVIGHERSVDWATLVSRLKSATEGNGPVVR